MKPNDGGPAFPTIQTGHNAGIEFIYTQDGMSLRALFAGMAMIGILACGNEIEHYDSLVSFSKGCLEYADALIEELGKET